MQRRPAKVIQATITRAIRAAEIAGTGDITIDEEGDIHIPLPPIAEDVNDSHIRDIGVRSQSQQTDHRLNPPHGNLSNMGDQQNERRRDLPPTDTQQGTLRWFWDNYKLSDHWLGDLSVGIDGLAESTRMQRVGLVESLLSANGRKPFAVMTREAIRTEMKLRTPVQAGNLLSALRGMTRWMISEGYLTEEEDPTIGLKSGKAKASRQSGGFVPWTEEDMAMYRAKWPLGTEARLMFDILHYTFLRLGDAYRFGPPHLRQIVHEMAVQIATEKSHGNTTVTVPVHPKLADSLQAARAAGIVGDEVFTGKIVRGRVLPMNKKAWEAKFKRYAVMAGVNVPKKSCHGVRKARAETAAYADCTESQMMAMFGWTDSKMPAHYIARANRDKLGIAGMEKLEAYDYNQSPDHFDDETKDKKRIRRP